MKKLNVLSLFDGMSCGRIALERAGIEVENYYAAEVDKYAIKVSGDNYPSIKQVGDVTKLKAEDFPKIDLIIGGSPCQGFSFAGKQLNFKDPRSALFFEFVRLLKELKPSYFLLENNRMKKESKNIISNFLEVEPIEINSNLLSAQNRRRLYWTNIPNIKQPKDKGIFLADILENGTAHRKKSKCIRVGGRGSNDRHEWDLANIEKRRLTPLECERLQTVPDNYTAGVSNTQRYKMLGNGWTVDVITHILKEIKK
tara:strand:+ start:247 stop:1011 length:765 start_codon:yes stop_codon:yes gene_type:complete